MMLIFDNHIMVYHLHECILLHKNHLISFLIEQGGVSHLLKNSFSS